MIDVSLYYRAKAQCGSAPTAPVDEALHACIGDAKVNILMQDEPTIRARCSSENPGKTFLDCVDVAYVFGPRGGRTADQDRALNEKRAKINRTCVTVRPGTRVLPTALARRLRPPPAVLPATA